jgi:hypothetical protein
MRNGWPDERLFFTATSGEASYMRIFYESPDEALLRSVLD